MSKKQYSLMLVLALVAGLVGGVVSSQFLVGQTVWAEKKAKPQKVIEAQKFVLRNAKGNIRAELAIHTLGVKNYEGVGLYLYDKKGGTRVELKLVDELPMLGFFDPTAEIGFKNRVYLFVRPNSMPTLILRDESSNNRTILGYTEVKDAVTGVVEKRPPSSLVLFNEKGNAIWQAP